MRRATTAMAGAVPFDPPLLATGFHARVGWRWARLPGAALAAVALLWFGGAEVDRDVVRPATAVASIVFAAACLALTTRHTAGRERTGWALALAGTLGAMLPAVGSVAGIVFGIGLVLVAGAGFRDDRHRLLDASVAFLTMATAATAYLYPEVADLEGVRRADGYLGATQIVLAFSCVVFMTYRCRPGARPDAWLLGAGFVLGTVTGMPGLIDEAENHASTWVPTKSWEVGLAIAGVLVATAARLRVARPERVLTESGTGSRPNHALVGELALAALVVAFVVAHPGEEAITLPLLVATLVVRHLRSREIVRDNEQLAAAAALEAERRLALYRASFVALATAIEARDGYTGRHSEETVELAAAVGAELGLHGDELSELKTVALLHDVGKIGIPDAILHKHGELNENEWRTMRRHPEIGERILRAVPGLQAVATAVRHEHERWDGDGYPDGLKGPDIPLASRVVLVCDAWHAMTSDRPYRSRLSDADARAELRRCAGSQFDPEIVEALLRVVDRR